jgi:hypothetical protein
MIRYFSLYISALITLFSYTRCSDLSQLKQSHFQCSIQACDPSIASKHMIMLDNRHQDSGSISWWLNVTSLRLVHDVIHVLESVLTSRYIVKTIALVSCLCCAQPIIQQTIKMSVRSGAMMSKVGNPQVYEANEQRQVHDWALSVATRSLIDKTDRQNIQKSTYGRSTMKDSNTYMRISNPSTTSVFGWCTKFTNW